MAATGGAELQRADGAETAGAAAGATDGAAQAAALSDLSHAGKTGPPRAPHAAAAGSQLEPVFQLAVRPARAGFARALLKPGVENHFRLVPPHDGDPSRPCCLENGPSLAARPLPAPWPTLLPARSPVRLLPPPSTVASHLLRTDYGQRCILGQPSPLPYNGRCGLQAGKQLQAPRRPAASHRLAHPPRLRSRPAAGSARRP